MASISADLATNLVSVWLTDSSGLTTDLHGSNDLTNSGVAEVAGLQGDAGDFVQASSDYEYILDNASLSITGDFTWSVWIYISALPGTDAVDIWGLLSKWEPTGDQRSYGININEVADELIVRISSDGTGGNQTVVRSTSAIVDSGDLNSWVHLAVTVDVSAGAGGITIYKNGSSVSTTTLANNATSIKDSTAQLQIGKWTNLAFYFNGKMNQVCIWSSVLTSGNISTLYNGGTGIPYAATASGPANLKTYDGLAKASIKTFNGLAIASVKTFNGLA